MPSGAKIWGARDTSGVIWLPITVDGSGNTQIAVESARIMLPVDLQASYIMMPVDIQAQYITLDVADTFNGATYENQKTQADNNANRFETSAKKLRDVIIKVTTYGQLFGDSSNQRFAVAAGDAIGYTKVDISTLYFKNATNGENGVITILGVEE